uniref:AttH domain-containing protein n=1 Tax=Thermomicrobium roseum TaxID=500 RepID=A0A7C1XHT7_THERO
MRRRAFLSWLALSFSACARGQQPLAAPQPTAELSPRPASLFLTPPPAPQPVEFPRDFGSHDVLTEWWYYTGHLTSALHQRFGFEFVVFQVQRFGYPVVYAAHAAVTVVDRQTFHWDERVAALPQRQATWPLELVIADWRLFSDGQQDRLEAQARDFAFSLELQSQRSPILHDGDGYFSWAPETGSYYYSRTRLLASGTLEVEGERFSISGLAWNDHQWGNFLLGPGGWDWFALQLDDGTDLMLWQSRDATQRILTQSGTLVRPDGSVRALSAEQIRITVTSWWRSPSSGAVYPSGWHLEIVSSDLVLTVTPLVLDQELQALRSTGVIYWEGAVEANGTHNGHPVRGQGYVELTGYASQAP